MVKKIVLITTAQPATNPRMVKEADALQAAGYEVILLYCFVIDWAEELDKKLLEQAMWKFQLIGGSPNVNKVLFNWTRVKHKLCRSLNKLGINWGLVAEKSQCRAYDELLLSAKNISADWYIGHNLGALAVAVEAAKYNQAKAGFDFEDHYRGEITIAEKSLKKRIVFLENKYVPALNYFSTASDLITAITKKNHPLFHGKIITLNNCFPLNEQPLISQKNVWDNSLHLFWFSQTIGINRGLEILVQALQKINDPDIQLTLAGRCDEDMANYIKMHGSEVINNIHFAGIIEPKALPAFSARFDVGMGLEIPLPENRDICLTNKVFTYLLAGNAMILSDTSMQTLFNKKYNVGETFAVDDVQQLKEKILLYKNPLHLSLQKQHNYQLAKTQLNWDKESLKLLAIIN